MLILLRRQPRVGLAWHPIFILVQPRVKHAWDYKRDRRAGSWARLVKYQTCFCLVFIQKSNQRPFWWAPWK